MSFHTGESIRVVLENFNFEDEFSQLKINMILVRMSNTEHNRDLMFLEMMIFSVRGSLTVFSGLIFQKRN